MAAALALFWGLPVGVELRMGLATMCEVCRALCTGFEFQIALSSSSCHASRFTN